MHTRATRGRCATRPCRPYPSRGPAGTGSPRAPPARASCCRPGDPPASVCARWRTTTPGPERGRASGGRDERGNDGRASARAAHGPCGVRCTRTASSPLPSASCLPVQHPARPQMHRPDPPPCSGSAAVSKSEFAGNVNLNRSPDMRAKSCAPPPSGNGSSKPKPSRTARPPGPLGRATRRPAIHRVRPEGIEPSACGLKDRCSLAPRREPLTTELRALVFATSAAAGRTII